MYKLMMENNEDLARIITLENGKVLAEAKVCLFVETCADTDQPHRGRTHIQHRSSRSVSYDS